MLLQYSRLLRAELVYFRFNILMNSFVVVLFEVPCAPMGILLIKVIKVSEPNEVLKNSLISNLWEKTLEGAHFDVVEV